MFRIRAIAAAGVAWAIATGPVSAELADGRYGVTLSGATDRVHVADVVVADGAYEVRWHEEHFEDAFLSMRPFRCLVGPEFSLCRQPYLYDIARQIGAGDLVDLEYDLMFIWKRVNEYGINFWNGMYYTLTASDDGLRGVLHELDMNILAVPPAPGEGRPITRDILHEAEPDSHWLPHMSIAPL